MKNVAKILEMHGHKLRARGGGNNGHAVGGDMDPVFHVSIENKPYMRLVIEGIGLSPDGRQLISVAHYYTQHGDPMRDPEVVFLVDPLMEGIPGASVKDGWYPVSFQQDGGIPVYHVAMKWEGGRVLECRRYVRDIKSFSRTWNRNIKEQGFVEAAELAVSKQARFA